MKIIGITGAIASGKSTVAAILKNKGAIIIDADKIAREVVEPGRQAWGSIIERFGADVLNHDGRIDRPKLADIVFSDPEKLEALNDIVHPAVLGDVVRELDAIEREYGNGQPVVLDVPLLIEVGWHRRCDLTIIVRADDDVRLKRLMRRGLSAEDAGQRIDLHRSKDSLESKADVVIENNGTLDDLSKTVEEIWNKIQQ